MSIVLWLCFWVAYVAASLETSPTNDLLLGVGHFHTLDSIALPSADTYTLSVQGSLTLNKLPTAQFAFDDGITLSVSQQQQPPTHLSFWCEVNSPVQ